MMKTSNLMRTECYLRTEIHFGMFRLIPLILFMLQMSQDQFLRLPIWTKTYSGPHSHFLIRVWHYNTHQSVSWQTPQSCSWQDCTLAGYCPSNHRWTGTWHRVTRQTSDYWVVSLGGRDPSTSFLS
jgi:hypothetical protein